MSKKHGIRHIPGYEVHHIDMDTSNNSSSNLFQTKQHGLLHDQIRFLLNEWHLSTCKYHKPASLVRYFIRTGEMLFDKERSQYRMNPVEGGVLREFEKVLNSLDIHPPYSQPELDVPLAIRRIREIPVARLELEVSILEIKSGVRSAMLHTTTKSTPSQEERREET